MPLFQVVALQVEGAACGPLLTAAACMLFGEPGWFGALPVLGLLGLLLDGFVVAGVWLGGIAVLWSACCAKKRCRMLGAATSWIKPGK